VRSGVEIGEFEDGEFFDAIRKNKIKPLDYYWTDSMHEWKRVQDHKYHRQWTERNRADWMRLGKWAFFWLSVAETVIAGSFSIKSPWLITPWAVVAGYCFVNFNRLVCGIYKEAFTAWAGLIIFIPFPIMAIGRIFQLLTSPSQKTLLALLSSGYLWGAVAGYLLALSIAYKSKVLELENKNREYEMNHSPR